MSTRLKGVSLDGTILVFATTISLLCTQESGRGQSRSFPRAEEVSRRWLTRHPRARDEAEKLIIAVMDDIKDEGIKKQLDEVIISGLTRTLEQHVPKESSEKPEKK